MTYTLIQKFNNHHIHFQFNGPFQGKDVLWNTHLYTLSYFAEINCLTNINLKQFIDIEPAASDTMNLQVALNIPVVNEPAIQKMMIMIRQYKKLSAGRHEYG
ncbi:MAG: hypothetical protein OEW97_06955 [Gammaproteobacteria bacterium]|nr:hypothetical protein [Gammaproteobacteria bacterium]